MSAESGRLDAEARALRALAGNLESLLERPWRLLHRMMRQQDLVGPVAQDTGRELGRARGVLGRIAGELRRAAAARAYRSRWIEDHDSAAEDVEDFVTGRDRTPWS